MFNFLKKIIYKKKKIFLRSNVKFEGTIFEGKNKVGRNSDVTKSKIGFATYIGDECYLRQSKIGRYCSIGSWVKVISGKHPLDYVMTHPIVFNDSLKKLGLASSNYIPYDKSYEYIEDEYYIEIGNDVWVGQSVEIMSGVKIGDGVVIAAGAVVTKDVEPYSIIGGVPAKIIKKRFEDEEIEKLLKIKIWEKDLKWIKENVGKMSDIKTFLRDYFNN